MLSAYYLISSSKQSCEAPFCSLFTDGESEAQKDDVLATQLGCARAGHKSSVFKAGYRTGFRVEKGKDPLKDKM